MTNNAAKCLYDVGYCMKWFTGRPYVVSLNHINIFE